MPSMDDDVELEEPLDRLLREIATYLAVVDAFRNEDLEPEWAAEMNQGGKA